MDNDSIWLGKQWKEWKMGLLEKFKQNCLDAADTAEDRLLSLLRDNADTEFGKKYSFSEIHSRQDYRNKVPLTDFEDYAPAIERMIHGEKNILTVYPVVQYAHTSGSLGAAKLIPVTDRGARVNLTYSEIGSEVADNACKIPTPMPENPKILLLLMITAQSTPDGTLITNVSGKLLLDERYRMIGKMAVKPDLIYCDAPIDRSYLQAFYGLKEKNVVRITAPFMSAVSDFFCYIESHWEKLCRDIEEGRLRPDEQMAPELIEQFSADLCPDPKRAEELRTIFARGFGHPTAAEIWPHLIYVSAVGSGSFMSYTDKARRFTGKIPLYMSVYAASEGFFAVAVEMNRPENLLIPEAGYFEFIPEEAMELPEEQIRACTREMNELCPGKKYEMVVTNLSGLYRYRIGDVITVNGYYGQSPFITFAYRRHQLLNIVGEKTSEAMMEYAINGLREETGLHILEWSVCADYSTSPARYRVFMETEPEIREKEKVRDILEKKLSEASEYYDHYVRDGILGPLELIPLQPQTYALYRDVQIWRGANPNQLKPVHMITSPKIEAFFMGLRQ